MSGRPAVFLDRDGTLIEDRGHLSSPTQVFWIPGATDALRRLQDDFLLFIVTNQPGIAEGLLQLEQVQQVNLYLLERLAAAGITISDVYVCPHRRTDGCQCIKPFPYFLQQAARQYGVDLGRSFTVGDHPHDVLLGQQVGGQGIYVCTGHGWKHLQELPPAVPVVPDIRAAAEWILACSPGARQLGCSASEIQQAAERIRSGGLVAFPTETVYGLGANALDRTAVQKVFQIKNRPSNDPLIVHVGSLQQAQSLVLEFPESARRLAQRYWPGPLSLVLPKAPCIPDEVTAGLPTVAVRMPAHAVALALLWQAQVPIAAPSANPFGRLSPTTADHVRQQIGQQVDIILDGGPCWVGVESTIVSFAHGQPTLLRPGGIPLEQIEELIGPVQIPASMDLPGQAPGRFPRHYAPHTPLVIGWDPPLEAEGKRIGLLCLQPPPQREPFAMVEVLSQTGDLAEAAANLYAALRRLDQAGLDLILAHPMPEIGLGRAIMDRLRKASS
ncbi:MAG: L-threonylcarbamoyladenylate synthase [Thermoguttaceae bacterium]|nr:L-threonylcarbamoyladenylate synthase [Thermoguttaceae bacterium]MDW8037549.1 L-threonylcarbamoyladenylate synthase [Thermoguttaceae bacterium]